ncbi:hypothetical protein AAY473_026285 [Plecturocebus cupreus]
MKLHKQLKGTRIKATDSKVVKRIWFAGWVQWLMPLNPALWEAKVNDPKLGRDGKVCMREAELTAPSKWILHVARGVKEDQILNDRRCRAWAVRRRVEEQGRAHCGNVEAKALATNPQLLSRHRQNSTFVV